MYLGRFGFRDIVSLFSPSSSFIINISIQILNLYIFFLLSFYHHFFTQMMKIPYASPVGSLMYTMVCTRPDIGYAVGSLMYTMVCTRPDIGYAVGVVSQFMSNPRRKHWVVVKWILQYLKGTSSVVVKIFGNSVKIVWNGQLNINLREREI